MNKKYDSLVLEAKDLYKQRELIKLKIAKLAIEACTIRHGGRSGNLYTLTSFSHDTGIPFKRLSDWVITYKTIVSKIPDEIKTDEDWNRASVLSDRLAKRRAILNKESKLIGSKKAIKQDLERESKDVLRMYREMNENTEHLIKCDDALKTALYNLAKINMCPKDDEKFLLNINENLVLFDELIEKMHTRVEALMSRLHAQEDLQ